MKERTMIRLSRKTWQPYSRTKSSQKDQMPDTKKPRPLIKLRWTLNDETTSLLGPSMIITVRTFWTWLSKFKKFGTGFGPHWHGQTAHPTDCPWHSHINSAMYRTGPNALGIKKPYMHKMFPMNVLEPAQSEWASPILFVRRDRFHTNCIYHKKLDTVSIKNPYPVTRMDYSFDSVGQTYLFLTLNATSGNWHIRIDSWDKEKTTFT